MAKKHDQQGEDTPFNMAMLYYVSLRKLIDEKNKAKINNNIIGWYHGLMALRDEIIFKINKADEKEISQEFAKAEVYLFTPSLGNNNLRAQIEHLIENNVPPILRLIDIKLTKIMAKNNMIFPKIEISKGLEDLRASYGLG